MGIIRTLFIFFRKIFKINYNKTQMSARDTYRGITSSHVKDTVDPVSLEEFNMEGRRSISYLRCKQDPVTKQYIPVTLGAFDTKTAHDMVKNGFKKDPTTQVAWLEGFKERLELYKEAVEKFGDFTPNAAQLSDLFGRFLRGNGVLPEEELLMLRAYLMIDDSKSVIHECKRKEAQDILSDEPPGSWIFRESSFINNPITVSKVIAMKKENGQVAHTPFFHTKGLGFYCVTNPPMSGMKLPGIGDKLLTSVKIYPCLIDLLKNFFSEDIALELNMYVFPVVTEEQKAISLLFKREFRDLEEMYARQIKDISSRRLHALTNLDTYEKFKELSDKKNLLDGVFDLGQAMVTIGTVEFDKSIVEKRIFTEDQVEQVNKFFIELKKIENSGVPHFRAFRLPLRRIPSKSPQKRRKSKNKSKNKRSPKRGSARARRIYNSP